MGRSHDELVDAKIRANRPPRKPLSWAVRLQRAAKLGKFSRNTKAKASSWRTCAVGEGFNYSPGVSEKIYDLGLTGEDILELGWSFMYAVKADRVTTATNLYRQIQDAIKVACNKP